MFQTLYFQGQPMHIAGHLPAAGEQVKPFTLVSTNLSEVSLRDHAKKRKVLNIFPSIDTGVCAASVRKFNELAGDMENTIVFCISADLPFAQSRFCGSEGLSNVLMLSTLRSSDFAHNYGVEITDGPLKGLTARAVIVLDESDTVLYSQLVEEITQEPDYMAALMALKG